MAERSRQSVRCTLRSADPPSASCSAARLPCALTVQLCASAASVCACLSFGVVSLCPMSPSVTLRCTDSARAPWTVAASLLQSIAAERMSRRRCKCKDVSGGPCRRASLCVCFLACPLRANPALRFKSHVKQTAARQTTQQEEGKEKADRTSSEEGQERPSSHSSQWIIDRLCSGGRTAQC